MSRLTEAIKVCLWLLLIAFLWGWLMNAEVHAAVPVKGTITQGHIDRARPHKGIRFVAPVSPTLTCIFFTKVLKRPTIVVSNATWTKGDDTCFEKGSILVKLIDPNVTTLTLVIL